MLSIDFSTVVSVTDTESVPLLCLCLLSCFMCAGFFFVKRQKRKTELLLQMQLLL